MLPLKIVDGENLLVKAKVMDKGLFHHHRFEKSRLLQAELMIVPYWHVAASAIAHVKYLRGETGGGQVYVGGGSRVPTFMPT